MIRFLMLILAVMSLETCFQAHAQENIDMVSFLNIAEDIAHLENRIASLIKKMPEIANIQGIRQFHVFWLDVDLAKVTKKENYKTRSFLCYLRCGYDYLRPKSIFGKKKKYLKTTTLITDSLGNLLADGDVRMLSLFNKEALLATSDEKLAKMFFDDNINFAFWLAYPHSMLYMVGLKGSILYAIKSSSEGLTIYPWEEFIECCFNEWRKEF